MLSELHQKKKDLLSEYKTAQNLTIQIFIHTVLRQMFTCVQYRQQSNLHSELEPLEAVAIGLLLCHINVSGDLKMSNEEHFETFI